MMPPESDCSRIHSAIGEITHHADQLDSVLRDHWTLLRRLNERIRTARRHDNLHKTLRHLSAEEAALVATCSAYCELQVLRARFEDLIPAADQAEPQT